ncbi:MAG: hypothetical protein EBY40_00205 [Marivivens sp.]|nr:hypothetical protein [Marivivens sp.]NDH01531.1 hypothetical protein [Marivivens sp.]
MSLTKSEFLQPVEIHGPFPIDGLGEIWVREIPFADAGFIYESDSADNFDTSLRIIVASVCDGGGVEVFSRDDYQALRKVPTKRLEKLMQVVTQHSGFGDDVDELAKN